MFSLFWFIFSISIRSPHIEPNPIDYEITAGIKTDSFHWIQLWERENGSYYRGIDFEDRSKIYKNFEILSKYYFKEARNIHFSQFSGYLENRIKNFKVKEGISLIKDKVLHQNKWTGYLELNYKKNLGLRIQSNFKDYNAVEGWIEIYVSKYITWKTTYKKYGTKSFYQTKAVLEIKL